MAARKIKAEVCSSERLASLPIAPGDNELSGLKFPARIPCWYDLITNLDLTAQRPLLGLTAKEITKTIAAREARWTISDCFSHDHIAEQYRQVFGRKWNGDFDLMPDSLIENWRQMVNSRASRFLRAFAMPDTLVIPRFVEEALNTSQIRSQLNELSLLGLPTNPLRFSESMLLAFAAISTEDLAEAGKDPINILLLKANQRVEAIVKLIFQSSRPIEPGNYRVQRIEEPDGLTQAQYVQALQSYKLPRGLPGSIIYTREDSSPSKDLQLRSPLNLKFDPLTVQIFATIYDALRKTHHVNERSQAEITGLAAYSERLANIRDRIQKSWSATTDLAVKKELQNDLKIILSEPPQALSRPKTPRKRQARTSLNALRAQAESTECLINPVAAVNRLLGILNRLTERTYRVPQTNKWNSLDRDSMLKVLATAHQGFKDLEQQIYHCKAALSQHWPCIDPSDAIMLIKSQNRELLKQKLNFPNLDREAFRFRPFRTFANAVKHITAQMDSALDSKGPRRSIETLIQAVAIVSRLQEANVAIAALMADLSYQRIKSLEQVALSLAQLKKILERPLPYPLDKRPTPGLDKIFNAYLSSVRTSGERIASLIKSNPGQPTITDRLIRLSEFLARFNPELLLLDLELPVFQFKPR